MTTSIYDLIRDRQEQIEEALHNDDASKLRYLAATSCDEDERQDLLQYAQNIDDADWAHDRAVDETLTQDVY